jgi:DNA-binding LytR/AlgR family response regulator
LDEIDYIESLKNHVKIVVGKETHMTLLTISEMEEKLPPQRFLRIHRSYIVSVGKITQFTHTNVMIGTQFLPIGNLYKNEVLKKLNQNLIGG